MPMVTMQEEWEGDTGRVQGNRAWWGLCPWSKAATGAQHQPRGVPCKYWSSIIKSSLFSNAARSVILKWNLLFSKQCTGQTKICQPARPSLRPSVNAGLLGSFRVAVKSLVLLNANEFTGWRLTNNYSCLHWRRKPKHNRKSWIFNSFVLK